MSWRHPTEADWDRERDYRKHEPRPSDPLPARFQTPLSTAMDIVVLVKAMPNYAEAAALIERFAEGKAAEQRLEAVAAGARP